MAQGGYWIDTASRRVGNRAGVSHALDRLEIVHGNLFYARAIPNDHLITYQETWVIRERNWTITRFAFHEHPRPGSTFWKIEPDLIEATGDTIWHVFDGFVDLGVYEGSDYDLQDADEFADALSTGDLSVEAAVEILQALDALCRELHANGYSGQKILEQHAHGLPR